VVTSLALIVLVVLFVWQIPSYRQRSILRYLALEVATSQLVLNVMDDSDDLEDPLQTFCDNLAQDVPEGGTAKAKRFDNSDGEFWPERSLNRLVTKEIVREVFNAANHAYDSTLIDFVVGKAKKLFAITANIDSHPSRLLARMKFFKSTETTDDIITDDSLTAEMEILDNSGTTSAENNSTTFADKLASRDGKLWRPSAKDKFSHNLWKAMSPIFSTSRSNYNFKTSTILPFAELSANIKSGAFSTIHKVAIYDGYYKDDAVPVGGPSIFS
jgi:hypothetical protein